jgi:hypothetical protein
MLEEVAAKISEVGAYYIQHQTFTYLRVSGTNINPKKLPRYPSDRLILFDISRQLVSTYNIVQRQHKATWAWPIAIGSFSVDQRQDIPSFECEWDQYPLEEYNSPRPYFDNIRRVQHLACKTFQHADAIEDHWMNTVDDYNIRIRDYCRMTLYLAKISLKVKVPLKIVQKDMEDLPDPLFNKDKIGDRPIMNVEVDKEENANINHRERHVIKLTKD